MGIINMFKKAIQVPESFGVDHLKSQTDNIKALAKDFVKPESPQRFETFQQAMKRLNLSENDLYRRAKEMQRLILILSVIELVLLIYLGYLIAVQAYLPGLGTFGIILVVLGQIFRYHFWLYQIRSKRLGCTFKEWFRSLVGGK